MKPIHAWLVAILVIAGVAILIGIGAPAAGSPAGSCESRGERGAGGRGIGAEPDPWESLAEGRAHRSRVAVEAAAEKSAAGGKEDAASRESDDDRAASLRRLEEIVAALRSIAPDESFHRLAWSLLDEARSIAKKNAEALVRLDELVVSQAEPARARGALLFAACLAESSHARAAQTLSLSDAPPELARVAWLARAFESPTPAKRAVPVGRFRSRTEGKTYPIFLDRRAGTELVAAAAAFAQGPIRVAGGEIAAGGEIPQDELFAREVAVIAGLATAAEVPGAARNQLWHWLEASTPTALLLGDAAAFSLAAAARDDARLAVALLEYAARRREGRGFDPRPSAVRAYLARFGLLGKELASHLGEILRGDGSPISAFERTYAIAALGELLRAPSEEVSLAAARVALERVLDVNHRRVERNQVLDWLAIAQHELLFYAATTILDFERDPKIVANALHDLALVRDQDRSRVAADLPRRFDAEAPEEVRAALVSTLGEVGDASILAFLVGITRRDASPDVRRAAARAMAAIEARATPRSAVNPPSSTSR